MAFHLVFNNTISQQFTLGEIRNGYVQDGWYKCISGFYQDIAVINKRAYFTRLDSKTLRVDSSLLEFHLINCNDNHILNEPFEFIGNIKITVG